MPARRPMTPADIRRQVVVEELDLAGDGRLAVVARRSIRGNRYVDNEQLFVALRHRRQTVEYVLYPEESHVFSSSGRPDRRIDRMTRMLDWFDRCLRD